MEAIKSHAIKPNVLSSNITWIINQATMTTAPVQTLTASPATERKHNDFVPRGNKTSSPLGTTLFLGLRIGDCVLQYAFLALGLAEPLVNAFGGSILQKPDAAWNTPLGPTSLSALAALGLTPYRAMLLAMISAAAVKHVWFVLCVAQEAWTITGAMCVGLFNTFWFSTSTLFFLTLGLSVASSTSGVETIGLEFYLGTLLFWAGIGMETMAEVQRKQFKDDPQNKGKCYMNGLFSICRHINYTGYSAWRTGLALATGGWILAGVTGLFFVWDFSARAIPALDAYCTKRYTDQWAQYKRQTPYTIVPYIL